MANPTDLNSKALQPFLLPVASGQEDNFALQNPNLTPLIRSLEVANQDYHNQAAKTHAQAAKTDEKSDQVMDLIGELFKQVNEENRAFRTQAIQWESRYRELELTSQAKTEAERSLKTDEVGGLKKLVTEKLKQSQDAIEALQNEVKSLKEQHEKDQKKISDLETKVGELEAKSTNNATAQSQVNKTLTDGLTDVNTRVTKVNDCVTTVNTRVTAVSNRVTALHTALCKEIGATQKWISTIAAKVTW